MFIDELIKFCYEKSENIKLKAEPQVFIDIAEILEDYRLSLKMRELNAKHLPKIEEAVHKIELIKEYDKGYNKAIDEFTEKLMENIESFEIKIDEAIVDVLTLDYIFDLISNISEELKGREENDNW